MISKITQSFIKDFREFQQGKLCGNIITERWINDRLLEDPDEEPGAMQLGAYFEFITTGNLPKNGLPPQPVYQKSILSKKPIEKCTVADMYEDYRLVHDKAVQTKQYLDDLGFKIVAIGKDIDRGRYKGSLDLICEVTREIEFRMPDGTMGKLEVGELIILDMKYSGWLKDTVPSWQKHGWKWSDVQKEYHGTQAIQYHFVGGGMKFFFFVISSDKSENAKLFYVPVTQAMIDRHIAEGNDYMEKLPFYHKTGLLEARPNFNVCRKCPLRNECKDRHRFPTIEVVDLTPN